MKRLGVPLWSIGILALLLLDPLASRVVADSPPGPADLDGNPGNGGLVMPRQADGDGSVTLSGERKQWHKVTLTLDGPFAHENDVATNPFTDLALQVTLTHQEGSPSYVVPGYFAADGNAGESSAQSGTQWRAHLSPDKAGVWNYRIGFHRGNDAALGGDGSVALDPFDGKTGSFTIEPSDKTGRDLRGKGRLQYVGERYLRFAGSQEYFLKAGPDAPETMLGYEDFDGTIAGKAKKVPLKTWTPHLQDWKPGDPTWKNGKGKGLIGAINYLSDKGCNAFSFLTYNAGGDGDNVWPFVERDDKLHYDCSKLDQWAVVFDHGTAMGMHLHFKMQETEIDDHRRGLGTQPANIPESLDGGKMGRERKLYCRELIARFGHSLALNWNIGEENTQTSEEIRRMVQYVHDTDPYHHPIVIHTYPGQQDKVYSPLLGDQSLLTGASLQNPWKQAHQRTLFWIQKSQQSGRPWVVANDEQNPAGEGVPVDPGYQGNDGTGEADGQKYTAHDIRKHCLWGTLMAGGAGVEYYFGYRLPQNDLVCEDFRSRETSWDYCRIALDFFSDHAIPFWEMNNADALVGNPKSDHSKYCLAKPGEIYLVYVPQGGRAELDLSGHAGQWTVHWFNPRTGGELELGSVDTVFGDQSVSLGHPPKDRSEDWVALVRPTRRNSQQSPAEPTWQTVDAIGEPTARHEAALVSFDDKLYLIGGRRINPVDVFDPRDRTWTAKSPTPMELHHFQAVVVDDAIYLIGAMTGPYPNETPLEKIVVYYPRTDEFRMVHGVPEHRRRGAAGAVLHEGKIYLVGGITHGHVDGFQPWLDCYDPQTGDWEVLADAPHARDHFQAVVLDQKLYCLGGRTTHQAVNQIFGTTVAEVDVFDFQTRTWVSSPESSSPVLPTPRAGNMAMAWGNELVVGGGESTQKAAHQEVEAFDVLSGTWRQWPRLARGRHGSGFAIVGDYVYTASGSGNRGGGPELASVERLALPR